MEEAAQGSDVTQSTILKALDWAYDASLREWPGVDSAQQLAEQYLAEEGSTREQVDSLIRWQVSQVVATSFATGLGGVLALAVTLPAELTATYFIQLRMIAAIAYMGGKPVRDERVRTLSYLCMCGEAAAEIASDLGMQLGEELSERAIRALSRELTEEVNERVSVRLLARLGGAGIGRLIPLAGGILSAAVNGAVTNTIGDVARDMFIES